MRGFRTAAVGEAPGPVARGVLAEPAVVNDPGHDGGAAGAGKKGGRVLLGVAVFFLAPHFCR